MINKKIALIFVFCFMMSITFVSAIDKIEYYEGTQNDATAGMTGAGCRGRTFTIGTVGVNNNYDLNNISFWWQRDTGTGTTNCYLYATSGGTATGLTLASGSVANSLISTVSYEWVNMSFSAYNLASSTQYAVICNTTSGTTSWGQNTSTPVLGQYAGGQSLDGCAGSDVVHASQRLFQVYGTSTSGQSVSLITPVNDSRQSNTTINFTAEITPVLTNITNETLYIWDTNGSIFSTITNYTTGVAAFNFSWLEDSFTLGSNYLWNVYACSNGTGDFCSWAGNNRTFTASAFSEAVVAYQSSVLETSRQNYNLQINSISSVNSVSAVLHYNGTSYSSTVAGLGGGVYNITNSLDVPLNNVTSSKNLFWELTFTLTGGSTLSQNSSNQLQEVNRTYLSICNSTYPHAYINITTKDAENPFPLLTATFKSAWSWYVYGGSGNVYRTYAYEDVTEGNNTFDFCMDSQSANYSVSSTFEIDGTGYAKNYHFLNNAKLTNASESLSLYLLNDSLATATEFIVRDTKQDPLEEVYISIQFYDVGTDTFYSVGMAKTSSEGKDLVYLNWYDSLYKFVFVQNGTTIKTTTPYKISETPQIFEIVTETTFEFAKFDDFDYSLFYNETTSNFVLTFVKPSGQVDAGCLRVIKRNQTNDYLVCETCEVSSSATVYCDISAYGNGTYIATFYATGSLKIVDVITEVIGGINEIYDAIGNLDGTVLAIILSGVIMTFFLITPVLGVIGMILGMLAATAVGFQPIDFGVFIGITIVGGLVIWFLKR